MGAVRSPPGLRRLVPVSTSATRGANRQHRRILGPALVGLAALTAVTACQSADGSQASPAETVVPLATAAPTTLPAVTVPPTTVASTTTAPATTVAPTTAPETTTTVAETTTTTLPGQVAAMPQAIAAIGTADGDEAARVQQRLLDLGFWLAVVDGDYGLTTKQAVMAFQKYHGLERSGAVDEITAAALSAPSQRVQARATEGSLVEIDKDRQVLMLVKDGITVWALNVSSGSGQYYLEENQKKPGVYEQGRSVTPSGDYAVNRERPEGWWDGDLGQIYRPKYFNGGIAIHGSGSIPAYPASHGCVRVSTPAMDMIWDSGLVPKGTTVVVYGNDVEPTGPRPTLPPATTAAPTTVPVDTTIPADTTIAPPADTTVAPAPETTVAPVPETTAPPV